MSNISLSSKINHLALPWCYSTVTIFEAVRHLHYAVLLDSADANHSDARYDIITAEPLASIQFGGETSANESEPPRAIVRHYDTNCAVRREHASAQEPLALVKQQLAAYFPTAKQCELPFSGGAIFTASYDLGRSYEALPAAAKDDLEFPIFSAAIYPWALVRDSHRPNGQQWQLVSADDSFDLIGLALRLQLMIEKHSPSFINHQTQQTANNAQAFALTSDWQTQISKTAYLAKFDKIQHYLRSGDCYQINLTQRFSASYQGDEWQAYKKLRQSNGAPFSAFMQWHNCSALSISPERFIKLSADGDIETKPIKGTAPRAANDTDDQRLADELQQSEKNRAENLMIVDLLRNDIGKVASAGSVTVPHLFAIETFPAVHHLVSTVRAQLPEALHASDLLRAAFPGGSITGAPKIRAMEIIDELEPSRRNIYCGSIGYISQDGAMDSSITIRTLLAENGQLYCWAGGGIVADSQGDAEYQETFDKVSKILPILE